MTHTGKCPCGCNVTVPHGCFYATKKCGKRYRKAVARLGIHRPCYTGRSKNEVRQRKGQMT
jgi:hypothetical protein